MERAEPRCIGLCILAPPSPSKVMLTCGNPLSSYPTFASATLSPEMIIFFSRSTLTPLKSKGSFLDLSVRLFASSLNSKLAVLPIIFLASAVSCIPGNWTEILLAPSLWTTGSDTPNSLTLFLRVVKFCWTA